MTASKKPANPTMALPLDPSKIKGEDKSALDAAMKQLSDASLELGKAVYEATSAEAAQADGDPAEAGAGTSEPDDDVIDAEFEVKDEK